MRGASICLALLCIAVVGPSAVARAAPTVTFKAKAVPLPGFPHTGNILGAGAALQTEYTIKGTEYGGFPPPLVGISVYLPAGTKLHPQGFATCSPTALKATGPRACPKTSKVTISGEGRGVVSFGNERVEETASIQGFFAPGGGLQFYTQGTTPVSLEFVSSGHYVSASRPYSQKFIAEVPLIETVPGAPDASAESINVTAGAAFKHGKTTVYYGTVPKKCPKGGFPLKSELMFAGLGGLVAQTVSVAYTAPCPRR